MNDNFPPRGSGVPGRSEHLPMQSWASGVQLGAGWSYRPGSILIGVDENGREIGFNDDRHAIMFAGTGGGKTSTLLKYNYERWPGSMIVTDPKGELWAAGHKKREDEAAGRKAYKFDPFGVTEGSSHCYNPLLELGFCNPAMLAADAALIADALIIAHKGGDPHWTDSAKNLIKGFILLMHLQGNPTLRRLRQMLHSTPAQLARLLDEMVESDAYGGVLANIGAAFMGKQVGSERELAGILSTAQEQTAPLDEIADITDRSDFSMADLRDGRITLNVILPGMRLLTHARAMRLLVQMSLAALERYPVPRGGTPVLFMLEELAALGPMRSVESAAGLMRGYGCKLLSVLQDVTQLKAHYPESWETFIGNAGLLVAFANADVSTLEHLSKMLGNTLVLETQAVRLSAAAMGQGDNGRREQLRSTALLEPAEISRYFAKETNRALVLVPGRPPIAVQRMAHHAS